MNTPSSLFGITDQLGSKRLSLDEFVDFHLPSVFVFQAADNSMAPLILRKDRLIIDRSKDAHHNNIVVVEFNREVFCRRLIKQQGRLYFEVNNKSFKNLYPKEDDTVSIIGVVTNILRSL